MTHSELRWAKFKEWEREQNPYILLKKKTDLPFREISRIFGKADGFISQLSHASGNYRISNSNVAAKFRAYVEGLELSYDEFVLWPEKRANSLWAYLHNET